MTLRLAATAKGHWEEFDGWAVAHNMPDLHELPIERFCSFVWWRLIEGRDETERAQLRAKLWMPPDPTVAIEDPRSPWNPENELNALRAFGSQLAVGSAPTG